MLVLFAYAAIAALFYVAGVLEIRRAMARERLQHDSADGLILHGVALLSALLWIVSVPVLLLSALRWLRSLRLWESLSRVQARIAARLPHRRARLAS